MLSTKLLEAAGNSTQPAYIEDVFSTWLYPGTDATQTINNGIDMSTYGGLAWFKFRSGSYGASNHQLYDTARGVQKKLATNTTSAEATEATGLTAFNTNGVTFGGDGNINGGGQNYALWCFRKQPKFFDVVTYTGTGSQQSINHALGSVPGFIIVKRTDTTSSYWGVYHRSLTDGYALGLNTTDAQFNAPSFFVNSASQTATQFTVGTSANVNASGGTYVAYLFAHNAGGFGLTGTDNVISCGSFTTDGSGKATVNLGYEPQWVLMKRSSGADSWYLIDNMRGFDVSENPATLRANLSNAESVFSGMIGPTATGFQSTNGSSMYASSTYIYIAIRRGPMKVPTSGTSVFYPLTRNGTASNTTITNPGFPVDWVFSRGSSSRDGAVWDRLRGALQIIYTSSTSAESTGANSLTGFDLQNGVRVGVDNSTYQINDSTQSYVNYQMRRAPSFFDEVCYTGTGSAHNETHNLGVVPELIIVKNRSNTFNWTIYSSAVCSLNGQYLMFTTDEKQSGGSSMWGINPLTDPPNMTSTTFSLGYAQPVNGSGTNYVAYLFASCPGVSKVGSYTGNGTTQTINCSFTGGARFVLIKRTDSTGDWYVWDTARGIISGNDPYLLMNSTAAEVTTTDYIDPVSSGFEISSTAPAAINASGGSYIYLAIA